MGAISQLNIDQFAYESGTFFESERTPLLISMVFGVGLGSILAGSLSRGRIELGMLAYALFGQAFFAALLATLTRPFFNTGTPWNISLVLSMFFLLAMGILQDSSMCHSLRTFNIEARRQNEVPFSPLRTFVFLPGFFFRLGSTCC